MAPATVIENKGMDSVQLRDHLSCFNAIISGKTPIQPDDLSSRLSDRTRQDLSGYSESITNAVVYLESNCGDSFRTTPFSDEEVLEIAKATQRPFSGFEYKRPEPLLLLTLEEQTLYRNHSKTLVEKIIPKEMENASRFIETKGAKRFYNYEGIFLYLDIALKIFDHLAHESQNNFLRLALKHRNTFKEPDVHTLKGPKKMLYQKLEEIFSSHLVDMHFAKKRSPIHKALKNLESVLTMQVNSNRIEFCPFGMAGRMIYGNIYHDHRSELCALFEAIEEKLYISEEKVTKSQTLIREINSKSVEAISMIHSFVTGEIELSFSMEKVYTLFCFACDRFRSLDPKDKSKFMEIAQDIVKKDIGSFLRQGKLPSQNHQGFYLLIAEKLSEMIPGFPAFWQFSDNFEKAVIEVQKNNSLDEGWEVPRAPSPKLSPKQQPFEEKPEEKVPVADLEEGWEVPKAPSPKTSPREEPTKEQIIQDELSLDDFLDDSVIIRSD